MLDAHFPKVLEEADDRQEDPDKFRLRQLFHAVRLEFLCDGEHLPKELKGSEGTQEIELPLEPAKKDRRRGHEIFDHCWAELNDQPDDWRFITPFGWQCDGVPRVRLNAPLAGASPSLAGCSPQAIDQFEVERNHAAMKRRAASDTVPFAVPSPTAAPLKKFERPA